MLRAGALVQGSRSHDRPSRRDIAVEKASRPARAAWQAAVQAAKDERTKTKALVAGLRQALLTAFAATPDTLADFGLTPRKKPVVKAQTKATAATKAKATRKALGTKGKKQKKAAKKAVSGTANATANANATATATETPTATPTATAPAAFARAAAPTATSTTVTPDPDPDHDPDPAHAT